MLGCLHISWRACTHADNRSRVVAPLLVVQLQYERFHCGLMTQKEFVENLMLNWTRPSRAEIHRQVALASARLQLDTDASWNVIMLSEKAVREL